jgi:hypothetical protein
VVYFRQDFSAWHDVWNRSNWPPSQRFDYFVRLREVCEAEAKAEVKTFARREAIRWALSELEGEASR